MLMQGWGLCVLLSCPELKVRPFVALSSLLCPPHCRMYGCWRCCGLLPCSCCGAAPTLDTAHTVRARGSWACHTALDHHCHRTMSRWGSGLPTRLAYKQHTPSCSLQHTAITAVFIAAHITLLLSISLISMHDYGSQAKLQQLHWSAPLSLAPSTTKPYSFNPVAFMLDQSCSKLGGSDTCQRLRAFTTHSGFTYAAVPPPALCSIAIACADGYGCSSLQCYVRAAAADQSSGSCCVGT